MSGENASQPLEQADRIKAILIVLSGRDEAFLINARVNGAPEG